MRIRTCIPSFPPQMAAPKLGPDESLELLSRVFGAGDEDRDWSALSAALKTKLGLSDPKKPAPTMSRGVELLDQGCEELKGHPQLPNGHLS